MLKHIVTLMRGQAHDAAQTVTDRNALQILEQQLRDCAQAIASARQAVAITIAQNEAERRQQDTAKRKIADLEGRAIAVLEKGQEDLATEAAEAIAILRAEVDASDQAQQAFGTRITRLKKIIREAEARLRDVQRGRRVAAATDKAQRLRNYEASGAGMRLSSLKDAEQTLNRLQVRQRELDDTETALADMDLSSDPASLTERLADAGCGAPLKASAADVLAELRGRAASPQN